MRIKGSQSQQVAAASRMRHGASDASSRDCETAAETSSSRALIPLAPVQSCERTQTVVRQPASFLAHLIATEQAMPQTRERRRLDPQAAAAIYSAAGAHVPARTIHALSRAM